MVNLDDDKKPDDGAELGTKEKGAEDEEDSEDLDSWELEEEDSDLEE